MFSLKNSLHAVCLAIAAAVALTFTQITHAAPLDIRVAWNFNGYPDPGSYAPNAPAADFNEILVGFTNQSQTGGHIASNLNDAISPYPATGVGVTWAGWRRENANDSVAGGAQFSLNTDWVDRAGTASQLTGNDDGSPTISSVTFTGLTPGNSYAVEVVMTGIGGVPWSVLINGTNANTTFDNNDSPATRAAWNPDTDGSDQNDWLIWNGVNSPVAVGGSLTINFSAGPSSGLDGLHAIRITGELTEAVPEPSTFVLASLGLAGLGLVAWRRRR